MVRRAWLFGLILAVPLISFAASKGIQGYFNTELRSTLRKQFPNADESTISQVNIGHLCEAPDLRPKLANICETDANLSLMSRIGLIAGAVGIALLAAIRLAGNAARNSRTLLLYIFKPGLYLTAITLVGLILTHAGLAIGVIYYVAALAGRIPIGIIAGIGIGALAGVAGMARSVSSLVQKAQQIVIGQGVSQAEAPRLWERVQEIAARLGALPPQRLVLGLDPNFFVTEANVVCLTGTLTGRTLYCSLPLMRILTSNELTSIIGHELGHFKGSDTKFSERFYPIYRGTVFSIASLQATGGNDSKSIALLPAIAILSYFLECFSVAESRIGRDRELAAVTSQQSVPGVIPRIGTPPRQMLFLNLSHNPPV